MFKFYKVFFVALLLCVVRQSNAQNWINYYPINSASGMMWGVESYDKGFYFAGMATQIPFEVKLYKTDVNGNILWTRDIGSSINVISLGGITSTMDGGVAITGAIYRSDTTTDDYLLKLNSCGDAEWSKIYDINNNGIGGVVYELKNGDFVISVDVSINNTTKDSNINKDSIFNYYNNWLFMTDNLGNLKWQKFDNLYWKSPFLDSHENILVTGYVYRPDPDSPKGPSIIRSAISKTSILGDRKWQTVYGINNYIYSQGIATCQLLDNEYYNLSAKNIFENNNILDALYLIKYDSSGNYLWSKVVGDSTIENNPLDIISMNDTTLLILSVDGPNILNDLYSGDLHLFKLDKNGKIIKEFKYFNKGAPMSFYKLHRTSDNKYIVAGMYAENSIFVLKLNDNLELDSIYGNDKNKYDYLCGHTMVQKANVNLSTDTVYIKIPFSSIATLSRPGNFTVYPNPSEGLLYICCPVKNYYVYLNIYDIIGRLRYTYNFMPKDAGTIGIYLGDIEPGIYMMELEQNGNRYLQKEIVE